MIHTMMALQADTNNSKLLCMKQIFLNNRIKMVQYKFHEPIITSPINFF